MSSANERAALAGLTRKRLRQMATSYGSRNYNGPSLSLHEQATHSRQALAAHEILAVMDEERLERLASDQLKGLMAGPRASYDYDGLALDAVSLAKSLVAALDADEIGGS